MRHLKGLARRLPGYRMASRLVFGPEHRRMRGVYPTFAAAAAAIPARAKVGYDHPENALLYKEHLEWVRPTDYAAFYWLAPLMREHDAIFDFGGNIGWSFYAFRRYLDYPTTLRWTVCDVPHVVEAGSRIAAEREASALSFTTDVAAASGVKVFYSSGTLQYVEPDLPDLIAGLSERPRHVLINRVPLSENAGFFTVQHLGHSYCPYKIGGRQALWQGMEALGYEAVDTWRCYESSCHVMFQPSRSLDYYCGAYFRLREGGPSSIVTRNGRH
jgi:putative methyltransferase (TIGR04325 family)